jgi:predicted dehydrogenase
VSHRHEIAVVGTGAIATVHAGDLARLAHRAAITAAVDPDPDRLDAFCRRWSVPRRYSTVDALLDSEQPDLVDLSTPPGLHAAQSIACLDRRLTVLCEKPPALSLAELDAIAVAERAHGGRFAGVVQHRFGSGARTLRALVRDGRLGQPMTAVCHTLWFRPDDYFTVPWRGRWEVEGGGPTLGHGIHQMDLLLSILGPWRSVVAVADRRARPTETEDVSAAIVTFADGAVATVLNSLLAPRETSYLRFDFAHATVELEHLYGYSDDNWLVTPAVGMEATVDEAWRSGLAGVPSGHGAQFAAVFDALDAGAPPPVELAEVRATMDLVTAIYASAFTGRPVQAGEIGPDSPFYRRLDGRPDDGAGASMAPWLEVITQ